MAPGLAASLGFWYPDVVVVVWAELKPKATAARTATEYFIMVVEGGYNESVETKNRLNEGMVSNRFQDSKTIPGLAGSRVVDGSQGLVPRCGSVGHRMLFPDFEFQAASSRFSTQFD